jgi:hypothetical protein
MLPYFGEQTCEVEISCDDGDLESSKSLKAFIT